MTYIFSALSCVSAPSYLFILIPEVNQTKLQGVKTMMELEAGDEPSPKKMKSE